MKNWTCLMLIILMMIAPLLFVDVGTHNHLVDQDGTLVGVQDYRCPERGHMCPKVEHDCDGDFNIVIRIDKGDK